MKKIIFAFLLISLGCATTTTKIKRPNQEYFDIIIKPLKTTMTVDEDIPVAVKIKNISSYIIFLPSWVNAEFKAIDEENKTKIRYYDHRHYSTEILWLPSPGNYQRPGCYWNASITNVSLCSGAEIVDTIMLKSIKQLMPGRYRLGITLSYPPYKQKRNLVGISEEFINIFDE